MRELYNESGLRCLILPADGAKTPAGKGRQFPLYDLVGDYFRARFAQGLPSFPVELFLPAIARTSSAGQGEDLSWTLSVPAPGDGALLSVLLALAGCVPSLEDMAEPDTWAGGRYALRGRTDLLQGYACMDGPALAAALKLCARCRVELTGKGQTLAAPVLAIASLADDGSSMDVEVDPLALHALVGMTGWLAAESLEDLCQIGREAGHWAGLTGLSCVLLEHFLLEDRETDELALGEVLELLGSESALLADADREALGAGAALQLSLLGRVAGWQVEEFEEIVDHGDEDGVRRGDRLWRISCLD